MCPGVALVDINLADDISGIEVARKLKQKGIPFIFLSAFSNPEI
jgi:CheY-like chemotaxis protein